MDPTLENRRRAIVEALEALGAGWHTRMDIARALNKNRLNPADIAVLEVLAETGPVVRQTMTPQVGLQAYVYTLKSAK